jgi:diguanylate cyclase (GGDEF)-like protein
MTHLTAVRRTAGLTVILALIGAGLTVAAPSSVLLSRSGLTVSPWGLAAGLVGLFFLADLCLLHIEVRNEAYSVTLAGVPLVLGLLLCDTRELVVARVLGSAAAFAVQRVSKAKAGYNLAAYAFEAALDLAVIQLLVQPADTLTVRLAVTCCLVVLVGDQLMSLLVVVIIGWHQAGRLPTAQVMQMLAPAAVCSAMATPAAYGSLIMSDQGLVGGFVLAVMLTAAAAAYRGFQVLHRRHQALAHVHEFVGLNGADNTTVELAQRMLEDIRTLMRASSAELLLPHPEASLHLVIDASGVAEPAPGRPGATDRRTAVPAPPGGARLLSRKTRDAAARAWLQARGARDAIVVPVIGASESGTGTLTVFDRLGDTGSFTRDDLTLLQTLAAHLSVAVSSGRRQDQLRYEATHDVLTGLGNRAVLNEAIRRAVDEPHHTGVGGLVLLLDLDRFKEVNDTLGHPVGDALLTVIAGRLRTALPIGATVVRLGGDEFAALVPHRLIPGLANVDQTAVAAAEAVAGLVAAAIAVPVELPGATLITRASIGVAILQPSSGADALVRQADSAMYAAKEAGRGAVVYTAELDRGRAERLALLADLRLALQRDELVVFYQPKLDLRIDQITGVEALVRWRHPRLGMLGPDAFISLAESNGLVSELTRVVLGAALHQCAAWRAQGLKLAVAVNLSARSILDPGLPEQISAALLEAGVPASSLVLEITESAVMDDPDRAVTILERIAAIGVILSLDDFGTGYSSLAYLQRLPVSEVKIDRSFVAGLAAGNDTSLVLVRSIINLGASLGLRVVAEGVEDAPTLELLHKLGCDYAQGYHIARPEPPEHVGIVAARYTGDAPRLRAVTA